MITLVERLIQFVHEKLAESLVIAFIVSAVILVFVFILVAARG